jgi:hypothetical protein
LYPPPTSPKLGREWPKKGRHFSGERNPGKEKKLTIFLNAVHRVVFGWPALDHMRSTYKNHENTNRWTKEIFMNSLNFPCLLLEILEGVPQFRSPKYLDDVVLENNVSIF